MLPLNVVYLDYKNISNNLFVKVKKNTTHVIFCIRFQQELVSINIRMFHCSELLCTLHFYHITIKISKSYFPIIFVKSP